MLSETHLTLTAVVLLINVCNTASLTPGHLEPLGSKNRKHPVDVVSEYLSPKEFFANYVYASKPLLFREVAKTSTAFQYWTDDYLANLPESATTDVEVESNKKENRTLSSKAISVLDFLSTYIDEDIYMVSDLPSYLRKDVPVPKCLICNVVLEKLVATVLWFSSGGTKSVLHHDDVDNINCLLSGRKELLFIDYKLREFVTIDSPNGRFSNVDVEKVDLNKYPGLSEVEFYYAAMHPGDCIYIPYKWFHQVNSHERNIAVNLWWEHDGKILPTEENCGTPDRDMTFADISLKDEHPVDIEDVPTDHFDDIISFVVGGGFFSQASLLTFIKNHQRLKGITWSSECDRLVEKVFGFMDENGDGLIQKDELTTHLDQIVENEDVGYQLSILDDILLLQLGEQTRKELLASDARDHTIKPNDEL